MLSFFSGGKIEIRSKEWPKRAAWSSCACVTAGAGSEARVETGAYARQGCGELSELCIAAEPRHPQKAADARLLAVLTAALADRQVGLLTSQMGVIVPHPRVPWTRHGALRRCSICASYAAGRVCSPCGAGASAAALKRGAEGAGDSRVDGSHSANGHTVSPLQRGQCVVPLKITSHPTQNNALSSKIWP